MLRRNDGALLGLFEAKPNFKYPKAQNKYRKAQKIKREVRSWNKLQKMSAFHLSRVS